MIDSVSASDRSKEALAHEKTAKRTVLAIIIILVLTALLIIFSAAARKNSPETVSAPAALDDFNGKPMGAMPGSSAEEVIRERFPASPIIYYTGYSELYTALTSQKIDAYVTSHPASDGKKPSGCDLAAGSA